LNGREGPLWRNIGAIVGSPQLFGSWNGKISSVNCHRIGTFQTPSKWVALCKNGTGTSENPTTDADVLDLLIFYPEQFRRAF
jgi:hypothetical protein